MLEKEKLLSLGSIVYLREGSLRMVVVGRHPTVKKDENKPIMFDYAAVSHPIGYAGDDKMFYFNHENIDKVVFEGFSNEDDERFLEVMTEWKENHADEFEEGVIEKAIDENE